MGASVRCRWQVLGFECELLMEQGVGSVSLSRDGVVVSRGTVTSVSQANRWAAEEASRVTSERATERRTGTD